MNYKFTIIGYDGKQVFDKINPVEIIIISNNDREAINKARNVIVKTNYEIIKIEEII